MLKLRQAYIEITKTISPFKVAYSMLGLVMSCHVMLDMFILQYIGRVGG